MENFIAEYEKYLLFLNGKINDGKIDENNAGG